MKSFLLVLAALTLTFISTSGSRAETPPLKSGLSGLSFLTGSWSSGRGRVAETGGTSTGSSVFTVEANGAALLRRDHTDLFDAAGKPKGGFDQIMLIYPENGALLADYSDGSHVIHYVSAVVAPGRSVTFTSAAQPGAPIFKLSYSLTDPSTLAVNFSMAPPGSIEFHPIATGTLLKGN